MIKMVREEKMKADTFMISVIIPSVDEFAERYPQYRNIATKRGRRLFNKIMTAENVVLLQAVTISVGLPAVAGIANFCYGFVTRSDNIKWDSYTKQFIGAVVCMMMESNGFEKVGRKRVPQKYFGRGSLFVVKGDNI